MDINKLEKMKVVDLRNELQARGLDTKGVKAVLVERLRAHLEGANNSGGEAPGGNSVPPGTPGTPGRRGRRTRSMTRSPSPTLVKAAEPELEPLHEEEAAPIPEQLEAVETEPKEQEVIVPEEQSQYETTASDEQFQYETTTSDEHNEYNDRNEVNEVPEEKEEEEEEEQHGHFEEDNTNKENTNEENTNVSGNDVEQEISEEHSQSVGEVVKEDHKMDVDEKVITGQVQADEENLNENAEDKNENKEEKEKEIEIEKEKEKLSQSKERLNRKRSHSASRSRSHSKERRKHSHSRSHSRSRSRSRSQSKRRSGAGSRDSPSKVTEEATNPEDEPTIEDKQFGLSWFDSDLHLRIDPITFTSAKPMTHEIYSLVWSGARTNYGVREGKVCYEVRLAEETPMNRNHEFRDEPHVRGFRVGFSIPNSSLLLGEAENSFGYCESGRKAVNSEFTEYGKPYQLDDVIGCYLDLDSTPCTIKYTLNGEDLGVAFEFDKSILGEEGALFPHFVTKGYEFHVNFADNENLLANVERPKRRRRKPKNESNEKEKETLTESNQENWKVVDETKTEDEEKVNKESNKEESTSEEKPAEEDVEMKEPNIKDEDTGDEKKEHKENKEEEPTEKKSTENGENKVEDDSNKNDEQSNNVESEEQKTSDEHKVDSKGESEAETGPSPKKRSKWDDDKRNNASSDDEYEEIIPEPRDPVSLLEGYELIALIPEEQYIPGPQRPESRKECEVILLVGLHGAGKTHWALNHLKENPDKRYHVIGEDALISKMTIDGSPRKSIHKGNWDRVHELCIQSLSSLEEIATKRRRNFILDQTNAYASAQRRKMKGFGDFKRIAVVCIPNEDELKRRITEKTEKGNAYTIRESTLNNIRANFTLPSLEFGWFDDIIYTDLSGDEAKEEVKAYNEKGKKALDQKPSKRNRRDHYQRDDRRRYNDGRRDFQRWDDRRGGGGGGGGNRWGSGGGSGGGGGGGGYRSGWRDDRGYGGGGGGSGGGGAGGRGYDNRNNRYSNGPQIWMHNNRNRYDNRYNRSGGGGGGVSGGGSGGGGSRYDSGGRYDGYGGGSRDYRDRDRDRNTGGGGGGRRDNYRSGGGNQRDFRPGHRDNRTEDSRGGYERSAGTKYGSNDGGYGQYNSSGKMAAGKSSSQGGKWSSYGQNQINQQHHQQQQAHHGGNWQQQQHQQHQYQQQAAVAAAAQQQQYWGYGDMQGYGNQQQQQWQSTDPNQQQTWMSWWQQQGDATQQQQQQHTGTSDANQYWSQYSYQTQPTASDDAGGGAIMESTTKN